MSRRKESIPCMLVYSIPWWVSTTLAGVVYVLMRWVAPDVRPDEPMLANFMKAMPGSAWIGATALLVFAGLNLLVRFLKQKQQRRLEPSSPNKRGGVRLGP